MIISVQLSGFRIDLRQILFLVLLAGVPACRQSDSEETHLTDNRKLPSRATDVSTAAPRESAARSHSVVEDVLAIERAGGESDAMVQKVRDRLTEAAKDQGISVPQLIAANLADLIPDPNEERQKAVLVSVCFGNRDQMIEMIQLLPVGPLRRSAVVSYGCDFAERHDLEAIKGPYEKIGPGHERTLLASYGAQAAYLSGEPEQSLKWLRSLEYPNEVKIAFERIDSFFASEAGSPADRNAFLTELQNIARENHLEPPTAKADSFTPKIAPFTLPPGVK